MRRLGGGLWNSKPQGSLSVTPPPKTLIAASVERVILGSTKGKTSLRIAQAPWLQHGQERVAQNANQ